MGARCRHAWPAACQHQPARPCRYMLDVTWPPPVVPGPAPRRRSRACSAASPTSRCAQLVALVSAHAEPPCRGCRHSCTAGLGCAFHMSWCPACCFGPIADELTAPPLCRVLWSAAGRARERVVSAATSLQAPRHCFAASLAAAVWPVLLHCDTAHHPASGMCHTRHVLAMVPASSPPHLQGVERPPGRCGPQEPARHLVNAWQPCSA